MGNPALWLTVIVMAGGVALLLLGIGIGRRLEQARAEDRALEALAAQVDDRQAVYMPVTGQPVHWTYRAAHAADGPELERQERIAAAWHWRIAEGRGELEAPRRPRGWAMPYPDEMAAAPAAELEAAAADVAGGQAGRPPTSPEDLDLSVRHMIERSELAIAEAIARNRHTGNEDLDA